MKQFRRARDITKLTLHGNDGPVGKIQELYFDDNWAVRYLVVRMNDSLVERDVRLAPIVFGDIDDADASMQINLHRDQIERDPSIERVDLISRQHKKIFDNFRLVPFHDDTTMIIDKPLLPERPESDLHGSTAMIGYGINTQDGAIGHLEDLVIDDEEWVIRYVEVNTMNCLPGKKVLVRTGRIQHINVHSRSVIMTLTRQAIEAAPAYDSSKPITPDDEVGPVTH